MNRAFEDVFGIAGAFDGVEMAGRTDKWILEEAASRAGVDLSGDNFHRFRDRYSTRLLETLAEPAPGKGRAARACAVSSRRSTRATISLPRC